MAAKDSLLDLPADLPVPVDDGAARHLEGASIPRMTLPSTRGGQVSLRDASLRHTLVVFAYPKTGVPGRPVPEGWDAIPGARGCTPETCTFRDLNDAFEERGARVYGLSVQSTEYQKEMVDRLHVSFPVLSDDDLRLQKALRLPTFDFHGERLLKRVTLVAQRGRIVKVFYPVFPPHDSAKETLAWLSQKTARE